MVFDLLDRYLLGEKKTMSKAQLIEKLLAEPSPEPAAAPFYRALSMVGARVADEAFIALRLAMRGEPPADDAVREVRDLLTRARSEDEAERVQAVAAYKSRVGATI